jgi:hypothetical protein
MAFRHLMSSAPRISGPTDPHQTGNLGHPRPGISVGEAHGAEKIQALQHLRGNGSDVS